MPPEPTLRGHIKRANDEEKHGSRTSCPQSHPGRPFLSSSALRSGIVRKARGWLQGLQVELLPRWALTRT